MGASVYSNPHPNLSILPIIILIQSWPPMFMLHMLHMLHLLLGVKVIIKR